MTGLLRVQEVTKSFGGVRALRSLSLGVGEGEVVGLVGPNGAGKTTLINVITGYTRADEGSVVLDDRDITRVRAHLLASLGLARTFQTLQLFENTSVLDNVLVGRHLSFAARRPSMWFRRGNASGQRELAHKLLALLDLAGLADQNVSDLPYGVRRRVEIARALAVEPRTLLLDEPTAGMSTEESDAVGELISQVAGRGTGVLLVDHNPALIADTCSRVGVLVEGSVMAMGEPAEVFAMPEVRSAYLGSEVEVSHRAT